MATVILGGLLSSTFLDLVVVPVLFARWEKDPGRSEPARRGDELRAQPEPCVARSGPSPGVGVAVERASDLIVMGVHGRGPVDVALFGSTAQHVVRAAGCPVITVPSS